MAEVKTQDEALSRYDGMNPSERCPDFDEDCEFVKSHTTCAFGAVAFFHDTLFITHPIDGFCPYVCGMNKAASQ